MSILKYKYKAHKFINYAFYIVVFIFGFLLGFTTQKLDFNKLISQVLMIDNVSAEELSIDISDLKYLPDSSNYNDEDFILSVLNEFNKNTNSNHSFKDYPYVYTFKQGSDFVYYFYKSDIVSEDLKYYKIIFYDVLKLTFGSSIMLYEYHDWISTYTNTVDSTNSPNIINSPLGSNITNVLDFEGFNLEFNENLFKDNPDFKEVCVPNNKDFVISTNNFELLEDENSQYNETKSYSSYGFIWFPYYPKGLESYLYDNSKPDNVWIPEEDETYFDLHPIYHYWLVNKEEIDRVWNLEDPGSFLKSLGYTSKYSYFGWYTHPFVVRYANSGLRQFSVFRFNEDFEFYSTPENGLDYFEKLEEARNGNVCFYIKKDFDVNLLNTDEFGDKYGDITIMGDEKLEISTSVNISNLDSKGLFEKVKLFLNEMSDSIDFVKDYIFDLYDSMPYLLKLFIISVFGLIVIKILIGMVVR